VITLPQIARGTPYAAYAYSYPHKTAYRPLTPARSLHDVWADEPTDALYLYVHIPFCEMRCGFCNLFTTANPREDVVSAYLAALERQTRRVRDALGGGNVHVSRMAIGGGTPTYLAADQLERLLRLVESQFGLECPLVPTSVETSPRTADRDRLAVLRDHGVGRVSIGVQSFVDTEVTASGRAQRGAWVDAALERIRSMEFPTLNLDLIYGLPGQSVESWLTSVRAALHWRPEEMYLYPLYVRPLTGLERWGRQPEDKLRLACYRAGRDLLLAEDYEQISMRMFRRASAKAATSVGTEYCCQQDGMVGLGCGARSYTRALHYSSEYAVEATGVRGIVAGYVSKSDDAFDVVDYGCELDDDEQCRRWVIKSILRTKGLDPTAYERHFGSTPLDDVPALCELLDAGLLEWSDGRLVPTEDGLERSDAIGPWLYSDRAKRLMDAYEVR
jgi:oxygen-independent coproporphyrinogen-3 oxidase